MVEREPDDERNGDRAEQTPENSVPVRVNGSMNGTDNGVEFEVLVDETLDDDVTTFASPEERVAALEVELEELREANLLARADFDNYRKRAARERLEVADKARGDLVERLLPVLDNLERACDAASEDDRSCAWYEGLSMVREQFLQVLRDEGGEPIRAGGEAFDPDRHEAVSTTPDPEAPEGVIVHELRRGYTLRDRVVRPSQVVTSSGPAVGGAGGEDSPAGA